MKCAPKLDKQNDECETKVFILLLVLSYISVPLYLLYILMSTITIHKMTLFGDDSTVLFESKNFTLIEYDINIFLTLI